MMTKIELQTVGKWVVVASKDNSARGGGHAGSCSLMGRGGRMGCAGPAGSGGSAGSGGRERRSGGEQWCIQGQ